MTMLPKSSDEEREDWARLSLESLARAYGDDEPEYSSEGMMSEANKQIVLKYVDAFNRGEVEAMRGLFTDDALVYGVLGWGGLDKVVPIWQELHEALAVELLVEDIIAEGETVAVRYVERGTSVGTFRGLAATGKSYEVVAMEWFVMKDGLIHRRWGARDFASQSRQMGLPLG